jgi:peptidylprolyl isomerase
VLSRLTRPAALTSVLLCALAALAACGDDSSDEKTAAGFDAVSISGPVGKVPDVEWKALLKPGKTQSKVIEEGDGAALKDGDEVLVNFAVSDDFSQEIAVDTYGEDFAAAALEVGADPADPTQIIDLLTGLIAGQIEPGMTLGTRIALAVDAKEEFGDVALNLSSLGIGNEDGFVLVADLESTTLDGPQGKKQAAPAWAPKVVSTDGKPTAINSAGIPKPDVKAKDIRSAVLIKGSGPVVEKGDLAVVNYLGQTWGGDKPFDGSYTKDREPLKVNVGGAQGPGISVIEGWSDGLVGVPVGSRLLIEIPPAKGYGKEGQGKDIKGDDILYFVVDILAAA